MNAFLTELQLLTEEGGWVLWGLYALAFGIAFALLSIYSLLQLGDSPYLPSKDWRRLLRHPERSRTALDQLSGELSWNHSDNVLQEIEQTLFAKLRRRIPFAFVLIGAAPLLGLLGTVSGMFSTFSGMSSSAAQAPVDVISKGISEALVTTQAGLIIGVPSLIVCTMLHRYSLRLQNGFEQVRSALNLSFQQAA